MHSFLLLAKLHMVFGLLFSVGIVFLIIWSAKTLPTKSLKKFGILFVIIGIIGAMGIGVHGGKYKKFGMHKFGGMSTCGAMQKSGTTYNQGMMQAMSERGFEMTEEEVGAMMLEVKTKMKEL